MSQNSADSSNGNNSKNIPTVVNNHADRLMDELFADIEELLSGDLSEQEKGQPAAMNNAQRIAQPSMAKAFHEQQAATYEPQPEYSQPVPVPAPAAIETPQPGGGGGWKKIVAGLGLTALLAGGGAWWLAKEGKINLGQAGFLNSASNADIKFSDYLGKALTKIDSTSTPLPSASSISIPNPPGVVEQTVPTTSAVLNPTTSGSFTKIVAGNPPTVEFLINGVVQQVKAGEKIGNSGWELTNAINTVDNEVVIKRNGELRSLKVGQQF